MTTRLRTTTGISNETDVPTQTIRQWANRGWVACQRDSSGRRLFDEKAVQRVRELSAERRRTA